MVARRAFLRRSATLSSTRAATRATIKALPTPPNLYGLPTSSGAKGQDIVELGSGESGSAILPVLPGAQAGLRPRLVQHMGEKLLKGEGLSHRAAHGQGFDDLLGMQHLHAARLRIQVQDDVLACELARDRIALEVELDHAVGIDFAHQMHALEPAEPAVRVDGGRQRW